MKINSLLLILGLSGVFLFTNKKTSKKQIITNCEKFKNFIYFPKFQNTTKNAPLLITLHGRNGDESLFFDLIPKNFDAKVIHIRANNEKRLFYNLRLKENNEALAKEIEIAGNNLYELIECLKYKYQTNNVIVFGFSQGASLALYLASKGLVNSSLAFSGSLPPDLYPLNKQNTKLFMYHGTKDTIVPYILGENTYNAFKNEGYNIEFKTTKNSHIAPPKKIVEKFLNEI